MPLQKINQQKINHVMSVDLKKEVYEANLALLENNLVKGTSGNVSAINEARNRIYIKPSGVNYKKLRKKDIVVVDLNGKVVNGNLNPSVDLPHHLYLYKHIPEIGSVIHTHSIYATAFAMGKRKENKHLEVICRP